MFLPLRKTMYKDRKAKDVPVVNYIFRDSLKQRVSDAETVINLHNALEKFVSLLPHFVPNGDVKLAEVDLGREYVDVPLTSEESKLRVYVNSGHASLVVYHDESLGNASGV
ncbi:uncharacterized protein LOC121052756 [Rosa chinensis]|uniref:uncharacterized protein LOC121052756 n=1 Tax=Rosa chinensis TaxID=74649 RepID=UPI001AD91151|nr:uncharacterized protein LOC121052756 [Rosa chinensis]